MPGKVNCADKLYLVIEPVRSDTETPPRRGRSDRELTQESLYDLIGLPD